jgi:hypothetical protein
LEPGDKGDEWVREGSDPVFTEGSQAFSLFWGVRLEDSKGFTLFRRRPVRVLGHRRQLPVFRQ